MYTIDSQQGLEFLVGQAAHIESQVYEIQYPDIQYPQLLPIDTSANEWARTVTFFSTDKVGQAEWYHHLAKDVPIADITRTKHEHTIEMAAIGYRYTLEELGQAMMVPNVNLSVDRASAARRSYEEFMDRLALYGDTQKNLTGLVNSALPTAVTAAATGTGSSTAWEDKTPDQIMKDVNDALTGIYTASLTVEMADTILLPVEMFTKVLTRRIPDTAIPIDQYLMTNNVYTRMTGQPLTMRAVRGLESAGAGDTGRMVAYRRDMQVLKLHLPMPHRFLPPWQTGPLLYDVPGIFRTGGVEIRRPGAVRYVDGIMDAVS